MTFGKRLFDIGFSIFLAAIFWPVLLGIAIWIKRSDPGPILYAAERMRGPGEPFKLYKFRTMTHDPGATGGVTGGDKSDRITATGRFLRRTRLDEFPQIWNVFRGDISFVGPRPPLREYVERFPELYARVLQSRPGLTGLATLYFHEREAALLARCNTAEETDRVYVTRCIPRKARLDLIYQRHAGLCYDLVIFWQTLRRLAGRA